MKPRVTLITLGVDDLQKSLACYRDGLGFATQGIVGAQFAKIVKAAHDTFWGGYAGYFQDPDDHLWEVAWNPQWTEAA